MRDGIKMKLIRKKKKIIWLLVFLFISSLLPINNAQLPPGGSLPIVYVNPMGPIHSIQNAIEHVADGGTIIVNAGTYQENINIYKPLTLQKNQSGSKPIIIGQSTSKSTIEVSANNVHINGFEIQNPAGTPNNHHGIFLGKSLTGELIDVSDCSISNCQITDAYWGIAIRGSSNTVISNTIFNAIEGAISIIRGNNNIINENTLTNNHQGIRVGIGGSSSITQTQIISNTITSNTGSYGIDIGSSTSSSIITQNYLYNIENAIDQGTNNQWDNGALGNWWSDYEGYDTNNNGIGDTPYQKNGITDNYPTGRFQTANNQPPIATILSITPSTATYEDTISFSGSGFDPDGDAITTYNWRSNKDGQLSNKASFNTNSLSVGTHIIYFKVYDGKDWSAEKTSTIDIQQKETQTQNHLPIAVINLITPNPATLGQAVQLQGYATDQEHNIIQWKWTSSIDGIIGSQQNITLTNLSIGTHTIYFQVKNDINQWSNHDTEQLIIQNITTTPEPLQPLADAGGPYSGILKTEILFDASNAYNPNGETLQYSWDFGDGNTSTGKTIPHSYNKTGTYTVTLTIHDNNGQITTDTTTVIIYESLQHQLDSEGSPLLNFELSTPLVLLIPFAIILCIVGLFIKMIKKT
jgi:parallel beta-helix repeat protein